ncbi:hypothetical protein AB0I10_38140 [Streptomyces sp. NPDC050636]|uniref:hypothetical protein n=1 Tax=Streptomyces sp. NPDC050636 TaxID=3154510 RepID=UPI0034277207
MTMSGPTALATSDPRSLLPRIFGGIALFLYAAFTFFIGSLVVAVEIREYSPLVFWTPLLSAPVALVIGLAGICVRGGKAVGLYVGAMALLTVAWIVINSAKMGS